MVTIKNLKKQYNNNYLAVNISELNIKGNQIFGFLGSNGAGKTSTIKMMVGLLKPTSGSILLNGNDINVDPIKSKKFLGYVPDVPNLFEKLSAKELIYFKANLYGYKTTLELEKKVDKLLDIFELKGKENNLIQSYSHGMKQKTAIISTLIHEPQFLIFDEPFTGLDPQGVKILKDVMKDYVSNGNLIFISSHILEIVENLCNSIAIIKKGEIQYDGTLDYLKKNNEFDTLEDKFLSLIV